MWPWRFRQLEWRILCLHPHPVSSTHRLRFPEPQCRASVSRSRNLGNPWLCIELWFFWLPVPDLRFPGLVRNRLELPTFEWLGFRRGDGLDDAKNTFGAGTI